MAQYDENPTNIYLDKVYKKCQNCKKPVEISPGNSSWVSSGIPLTNKVEFSLRAKCHLCGHINYYIQFMNKSELKKTDGLQE